MRVSLFEKAASNVAHAHETSWPELAADLSTHDTRAEKDGPLWSPAAFADGKRSNASATALSCAVFDLDGAADLEALAHTLDGLAYVLHTTFTPGRWRLVLPLAEPCPASAWAHVWNALRDALGVDADDACRDPAHIYYLPTVQPGHTPEVYEGAGEPLPWRALAQAAPAPAPAQNFKLPEENLPENFQPPWAPAPYDLHGLRARLRKIRTPESVELVRRILAPEALAEHGARDKTVHKAASVVAFSTYPSLMHPDAFVQFMRPCIEAMPCAPEGVDKWLAKARDSYIRAATRAHLEATHRNTLTERMVQASKKAPIDPEKERDWELDLVVSVDKEGNAKLMQVGANVETILMHHPEWSGALAFNELTKKIDIVAPIPVRVDDDLSTAVMNWFHRSEYKLNLKSHAIAEQILLVARNNSYDPLREYLYSLGWDGEKRLDTFFQKFLGVADAPHVRAIGRKWFLSAVARALQPGCKADTVLILQGGQGVGKSRALRALAGGWFSDTKIDIHDKDSRLLAARTWLIEMQELAGMRGREAEQLKAFFSTASDDLRPPYGRVNETFKRRSVFIGTTNEDEFLADTTGTRRFWPLRVGDSIDVDGILEVRDQLWGEAVAAFEKGEKWWLEREESKVVAEASADVLETPAITEAVAKWWATRRDKTKPFTVGDVAGDLGFMQREMTQGLKTQIGQALRSLKFTNFRGSRDGVQQRLWHKGPHLMSNDYSGTNDNAEQPKSEGANGKADGSRA